MMTGREFRKPQERTAWQLILVCLCLGIFVLMGHRLIAAIAPALSLWQLLLADLIALIGTCSAVFVGVWQVGRLIRIYMLNAIEDEVTKQLNRRDQKQTE
jgi:hypothetical protein